MNRKIVTALAVSVLLLVFTAMQVAPVLAQDGTQTPAMDGMVMETPVPQDSPTEAIVYPTNNPSLPMGSMMNGTPSAMMNGTMSGTACPMMGGMTGSASMNGTGMPGMDMGMMGGMMGGGSMSGMNMSGMDMSGMSMPGMDMSAMQTTQENYSLWNINPWRLLGWGLLGLFALCLVAGVALGVVWLVKRSPGKTGQPL